MELKKMTTPEQVLSALGELIVYKTEDSYDTDELVGLVAAYTKLLETVREIGYEVTQHI